MKLLKRNLNNKGFSLIELIVVMAIMTVTVGAVGLSLTLLFGSDAKRAAMEFDSQIDECRTGAMSRYDETLELRFFEKNTDPDETDPTQIYIDKAGFYTVKELTTITENTSKRSDYIDESDKGVKVGTVEPKVIGKEHRFLTRSRVEIKFGYIVDDTDEYEYPITTPDATKSIKLTFDRSSGLYGDVYIDGVRKTKSKPEYIEFSSGIKTYRIDFVNTTGSRSVSSS